MIIKICFLHLIQTRDSAAKKYLSQITFDSRIFMLLVIVQFIIESYYTLHMHVAFVYSKLLAKTDFVDASFVLTKSKGVPILFFFFNPSYSKKNHRTQRNVPCCK